MLALALVGAGPALFGEAWPLFAVGAALLGAWFIVSAGGSAQGVVQAGAIWCGAAAGIAVAAQHYGAAIVVAVAGLALLELSALAKRGISAGDQE